ncbi:MAG TPA: hypothetical protein PLS46_21400, partial [Microthrixaceae bacterium]|nr:hypothetical protein [Microthrixaceae bacterium]
QRLALGEAATAAVNIVDAIGRGDVKIMPEILVSGGSGGPFEALAAALTKFVQTGQAAGALGLDKLPPPVDHDGDPTTPPPIATPPQG